MTSNTQLQQVLSHLKQYKTITQLEAINRFNCIRLSPVILRLRKEGYDIVTHRETNNTGTGTHARYEYRGAEK
ncbi:helix-turn-helix domain-containing protein [Acinetobacter pseudolwoffii]|uniref:helix-turn-helix domain-containing protein n=1 Tax=Acinetobacter pseudolwoffii TaxID=2053287 RepID=UPI000C23BF9B|nr:helix-turn-helix domain-containing protein [Acinetobacter pseudolwoffii]PJI36516.1 DNA-binding protein [Acinetobacter pseudolwoffii]